MQDPAKNLIDILVPSYNQAPFLKQMLQSVQNQSFPDFRVLISDDGSTDNSWEIIQSFLSDSRFQAKRRETPSGNLFLHWNELIQSAAAPFVCILHTDDIYHRDFLKSQLEFMNAYSEVGVSFASATGINEKGKSLYPISLPAGVTSPVLDAKEIFRHLALHGNSFFICPSAFYRSEVFNHLGLFDSSLPLSADIEYWLRVLFSEKYKIGFINKILMQVRFSAGQATQKYLRHLEKEGGEPDFFPVLQRYAHLVPLAADDQIKIQMHRDFENLKRQVISVSRQGGAKDIFQEMKKSLEKFSLIEKSTLSGLGSVDRLFLKLAFLFLEGASEKEIQGRAQKVLWMTNVHSNVFLKWALKLSRNWKLWIGEKPLNRAV